LPKTLTPSHRSPDNLPGGDSFLWGTGRGRGRNDETGIKQIHNDLAQAIHPSINQSTDSSDPSSPFGDASCFKFFLLPTPTFPDSQSSNPFSPFFSNHSLALHPSLAFRIKSAPDLSSRPFLRVSSPPPNQAATFSPAQIKADSLGTQTVVPISAHCTTPKLKRHTRANCPIRSLPLWVGKYVLPLAQGRRLFVKGRGYQDSHEPPQGSDPATIR